MFLINKVFSSNIYDLREMLETTHLVDVALDRSNVSSIRNKLEVMSLEWPSFISYVFVNLA